MASAAAKHLTMLSAYFIVAATDAASSKAAAGVAPSFVPRGGVRTPQFAPATLSVSINRR